MKIVITGGAGFLGARLARALLELPTLRLGGADPQPLEQLVLVDRTAPPADLAGSPRVQVVTGDLVELLEARPAQVVPDDADAVVHLASAVSGECEADFDLGMRSNLRAGQLLLERCRALGRAPLFVFSSSLAVFGSAPGLPLPEAVADDTLPTPQSSYGVQKFVLEQLVADYGRKGWLRARNLRLMTVSVRPGRPNGAASSFLSGMIREPLAGQRSICPVPPETPVALSSPSRTVEGLLRALQTDDAEWGPRTALNLPALTTTPAQMAAALERVAGARAVDLIDWTIDPAIARVVTSWPARMDSRRAAALGLHADASYEDVVREYLREQPSA
ncbi:D-erythronate dehydrogenase [Ramlibacter rhizophilus]|uniref:NAD-dependent epimerase/dehydratase family protein n=1 Tax=Ramlibacter rhizophilus TaxID=1781167 RepID=A0A4Z0BYL1_9BURK|nr:D-erythronate dehydrogenase [Ramlibacter rhizophilus]TFZ04427.1 NAD-dependent epimerase/dehydratase family protein [Ramlibacter rhizophilus]